MAGLKRARRPTTPGEILREMFLKERGIKMAEFAAAIEVSQKHLSRLVNGHVSITPDMAVRLSKSLGTSVQLWLNMQSAVDAYDAEEAAKKWKPKKVFESA